MKATKSILLALCALPALSLGETTSLGSSLGNHYYVHKTSQAGLDSHHTAVDTSGKGGLIQQPDPWNFSLEAGWRSRYVSEGIDNLDDHGIWVVIPTVSYENWTFSAWGGWGDNVNYQELDLVLSYDWKIGNFTITPWYEHDFFFQQNENKPVPGISISYAILPWLEIAADARTHVIHDRVEGYYDLRLQASQNLTDRLNISGNVLYAYQGGYLEDVEWGSGNMNYSVELAYKLCDYATAIYGINYTQALTVLRRADLGDVFWMNAAIRMTF